MRRWVFGIFIITATHAAFAQTTLGQPDCGRWIDAKGGNPTYKTWLYGFLTALNLSEMGSKGAKDVLSYLSSTAQVDAWMNNYCKANPLDSVGVGAMKLYMELRDRSGKK